MTMVESVAYLVRIKKLLQRMWYRSIGIGGRCHHQWRHGSATRSAAATSSSTRATARCAATSGFCQPTGCSAHGNLRELDRYSLDSMAHTAADDATLDGCNPTAHLQNIVDSQQRVSVCQWSRDFDTVVWLVGWVCLC